MPALLDLDVLVVDCQATGASPTYGSVLEIGWGVVRPNCAEPFDAQAHWVALPQGHVVPRQVQKLTGYEPGANVPSIDAEVAWRRLRAATAHSPATPTAIHFARFELPFLREWSARFEPEAAFPLDAVCVHAIANRLYPELPRQSLRALAGFLGHSLHLSRRSLGHVEATAFVWRRLSVELSNRGIQSWEDLKAWLAERAPPKARSKRPKYPIDAARYRSLPDQPGVYRFLRCNGDVLYVGKAASLKKRAASHFRGRAGSAQAPEMLTQVADIQVTLVASALEAALLEGDLIKELKPPYNVQLTGAEQGVFYASRDFHSARTEPDAEHALGPLPSEYSLRPLAALAQLLGGSPRSVALRAQAVGVSALWPPDEQVFEAGWETLRERRPKSDFEPHESTRRAALTLARRFLLAPAFAEEDGPEAQAEPPSREWDALRVARHIERACAEAFRAYRRARWLWLLANS
ncbi:MAG TPA: GIY-YIG nuclease family protein, partial [Polyangiaceae bacterium]|nr:GIY-YIG nuclease family protein [Polyangiaceae bacterium]